MEMDPEDKEEPQLRFLGPRRVSKRGKAKLNICGTRFEARWSTFLKFPQTRLGMLAAIVCGDNPNGHVLDFCDDYDHITNEFFFERNATAFPSILNYYISKHLHIPRSDCVKTFEEEVRYWAIPFDMGPCCDSYYFDEWECTEAMKKTDMLQSTLKKGKKQAEELKTWQIVKVELWNLFENPETSIAAKIISIFSNLMVVLSTVILCVNTHPDLQVLSADGKTKTDNPNLLVIEKICIAWFTLEYIIRIVSCPSKRQFLKGAQNAVDLLAIFPFYIGLIIDFSTSDGVSSNFENIRRFVQILRIIRIVRIFKLARHSTGLQVLAYTVKESSEELGLLVLLLLMGMTLFSTLIYYAEQNVPGTKFKSIIEGFWWAIITMTTIGYGDIYPDTTYGKMIGCMCCISGILFIALPIPTIVGNFSKYYREHRNKEKMDMNKTNAVDVADEFDPYFVIALDRARRISSYSARRSTIAKPITMQQKTEHLDTIIA